ncbi:MAG: hypothetical protein WC404_00210 [Candidatus Omnitrophota bacterium]|jgi:hypothetical protein
MENFIASLPEEVKSQFTAEDLADPNITKYTTFPDFIKGHRNLAPMIAAKGVLLPKEGDEADRERFISDLSKAGFGRPEKVDGYKLSEIKDLHPGIKITPESQKAYFEIAHKLGISTAQADGLNQWYLGNMSTLMKSKEAAELAEGAAAETKLRNELGEKYDPFIAKITNFVKLAGGDEALKLFADKGIGRNPTLLKVLGKAVEGLSEDTINKLGSGGQTNALDDAKAKIEAMNRDPKHPVNDTNHVDHDKAVKERMELYKIAYPQEKA